MKTFGELNIGDELYSLNDMNVPWATVTKHKISHIRKGPIFLSFVICDYYKDGDDLQFTARPKTTIGPFAPSLEGVKEYWKRELNDKIERQEKEIENLKAGLVDIYNSLDKILKAKE